MLYVEDKTDKKLRSKHQMYQHFLEDEFPEVWGLVQTAIKNQNPIPKIYPSERRFLQILQQCKLSIKKSKKEWCDTCKAYSVCIHRATSRSEKERYEEELDEHQVDASDTRECFQSFKKMIRKTHGLE